MEKESLTLGELFGKLVDEVKNLMKEEVDLAKAEMSEKASAAMRDVVFLLVGGAIVYGGFLALVAGLAIILADSFPLWLAALLTGIIVGGIGYFFVRKGLGDIKRRRMVPEQTIETLKEDREWAKERTK
ncbi:MAG: phage holin family protein [Syntrophales bacterium]|nr:phage holin family protein [Syntrophales bacterium]MDD5533276.1 phage holin family protein [Syntrophales bacterium]HPL62730.1 phage holin family protein [Syntrophales bacterium]